MCVSRHSVCVVVSRQGMCFTVQGVCFTLQCTWFMVRVVCFTVVAHVRGCTVHAGLCVAVTDSGVCVVHGECHGAVRVHSVFHGISRCVFHGIWVSRFVVHGMSGCVFHSFTVVQCVCGSQHMGFTVCCTVFEGVCFTVRGCTAQGCKLYCNCECSRCHSAWRSVCSQCVFHGAGVFTVQVCSTWCVFHGMGVIYSINTTVQGECVLVLPCMVLVHGAGCMFHGATCRHVSWCNGS